MAATRRLVRDTRAGGGGGGGESVSGTCETGVSFWDGGAAPRPCSVGRFGLENKGRETRKHGAFPAANAPGSRSLFFFLRGYSRVNLAPPRPSRKLRAVDTSDKQED